MRSVLGGDPETGTIAIGATIEEGQVVRIHARDAASADRDLNDALDLRRRALGDDAPAGALMFTCNGRGRGMFGLPDHDATAVAGTLGDIPTAGFFAAGRDRAGRRRELPARLHGDGGGLRLLTGRRRAGSRARRTAAAHAARRAA